MIGRVVGRITAHDSAEVERLRRLLVQALMGWDDLAKLIYGETDPDTARIRREAGPA